MNQQTPQSVTNKKKKFEWNAPNITGIIGVIATLFGAAMAKSSVSERLGEQTSKWAESRWLPQFFVNVTSPDYIEEAPRLLKAIDPKQWRSNIVFWGTLIGGWTATIKLVEAIWPEKKELKETSVQVLPVTVSQVAANSKVMSWQQTIEQKQTASQEIGRQQ